VVDSMKEEEEEEYDVVVDTLQERIDALWKVCERNERWGMMDFIRLEQIAELKEAMECWKRYKP